MVLARVGRPDRRTAGSRRGGGITHEGEGRCEVGREERSHDPSPGVDSGRREARHDMRSVVRGLATVQRKRRRGLM